MSLGFMMAAAVLGTGCNGAKFRQPVGPAVPDMESLDLGGIWTDPEGKPWFVKVTDPAAGRLRIAVVESDGDGFKVNTVDALVRRHGDALFLNLREDAEADEAGGATVEEYQVARLHRSEGRAVLWMVSHDGARLLAERPGIEAVIKTNQSGGSITYEVTVTGGFERVARELAVPTGWQYLDMENPLIWVRTREKIE